MAQKKKETRIMLALTNKLQCRQNSTKITRLRKGLEVAIANAEEKAANAEDSLEKLINDFGVNTDVTAFLRDVSRLLYSKDEAESAIKQLHRIDEYLFEELDVPDSVEEK